MSATSGDDALGRSNSSGKGEPWEDDGPQCDRAANRKYHRLMSASWLPSMPKDFQDNMPTRPIASEPSQSDCRGRSQPSFFHRVKFRLLGRKTLLAVRDGGPLESHETTADGRHAR